jgi:tetratricopeptide (TPR) repeat protein
MQQHEFENWRQMNMKARALIILLCVPLLVAFFGCSTNEEKAVKYVAKGDKLVQEGDSTRALLQYKNALQLNPKSSAAMLAMGKAYLSRKEYPQAYRYLSAALELDPNLDEGRVELAALLCAGQPERALEEISKVRNPEPFRTKIGIAEASAYLVLKQQQKAIDILRKIKDADSNSEIQKLLAISLQEVGDFKAMEEAVLKDRSLEPKATFTYLFLARFAAEHDDRARAVKELNSMVEADGDKTVMLLRARVFEELKMLDEAETAYEKLPEETEMQKAKAGFYFRQGKNDKAQALLESILTKEPGDVETTLALIRLFETKGESDAALERIEKTLGNNIENAGKEKLVLTKASILADKGDRDAAIKICDEVLKQNQGSADAHLLFGRLMLDGGKFEEAEIHLQQAVSGRPDDVGARVYLARSQYLNKKESMAADTLNAGIRANPSNNELRAEYLRMLMAKGDVDQAIKVLDEGVELQPENLGFLEARGRLLASKSVFPKAEQDFSQLVKLAPDSAGGYIEMGKLMLAQSKPDKAVDWLKRALSAKNGWEMAIPVVVVVSEKKGDYKDGLALVESAMAKRDPTAQAFFYIGQIQAEHRDLAEAEKAFKRAIQLAPEWSDPHRAMAIIYASQTKIDPAIAEMEKMYSISASPGNAISLAMLYEQKGRADDARHLLDDVLQKSGGSPSVMNDLAFLYAEYRSDPKDLEKAAGLVGQALAKQPDNPSFLDTAAWVSFKRHDLESAWYRIKSALELRPDAGSLNFHAAMIANGRGDKQEASRYLENALKENLDSASRKAAQDLKKQLEG